MTNEEVKMEKLCISVSEMGEALGISRVRAYQLVKTTGFPALVFGRRIMIPVDGLRRWIELQSGETSQPENR